MTQVNMGGNKKENIVLQVVKNKMQSLQAAHKQRGCASKILLFFLEAHKSQDYLPDLSGINKKPQYERVWLLTVSNQISLSTKLWGSLQNLQFIDIRKREFIERKSRVLASTKSQVITISEIAQALRQSSFVASRKGRTAALLSGPRIKKRKLNEITGGAAQMEDISTTQQPSSEVRELKSIIAQFKGENEHFKQQIMTHRTQV